MALTFPAAFVISNAASSDAGAVITASASLPKCPPSRLQTEHVGETWVAETDTAYLTFDLGAATSIDTVVLAGLNLTTAATTRIRLSAGDASAQAGELYDSGSAAGRVSDYYRNLVALTDGTVSARYGRIDLAQSGVERIMAGVLFVGARNQVGINFAPGAGDTVIDPSVMTRARSNAKLIDDRRKWREWTFTFEALSPTERLGWIEDMRFIAGLSRNLVCIRQCDSDDLGRDTLLGLISEATPVVSTAAFMDGGTAYSQSFKIEERL